MDQEIAELRREFEGHMRRVEKLITGFDEGLMALRNEVRGDKESSLTQKLRWRVQQLANHAKHCTSTLCPLFPHRGLAMDAIHAPGAADETDNTKDMD